MFCALSEAKGMDINMNFFEDTLKGLEEAIEMEGGRKLHKIQTISVGEKEGLIVAFEEGTGKMYEAQTLCKIIPQLELAEITELLKNAKVDVGGYAISLNEDLVLWADDIWELGTEV